MRKINYPLIFGLIIMLFIVITAVFADQIAQVNPYASGEYIRTEAGMEFQVFGSNPPTDRYLFGTDAAGRDIFSRIVYGARNTLKIGLLVTLFKFALALPMAFLAGFGKKFSIGIIDFFSTAFSAVPGLIISIMIFYLIGVPNLTTYVLVLTLVSWGKLAKTLKDSVSNILKRNFIQGEIAIGKSKILIALQNVIPHLLTVIITYSFIEIGRALVLVAELGVFGIFVGNSVTDLAPAQDMGISLVERGYYLLITNEPEWGAMLSQAQHAFQTEKYWEVLFPAMAFFVTILGFNLLGEGLNHEVNKRKSMVIPWLKRLAFHLSPLTLIYEIKHYRKHKRSLTIKTSILLTIIVILIIPAPGSLYPVDSESTFSHVEEFSMDSYEGRLVGTEGAEQAADYIIEGLKKAEVEPLFEQDYRQEFDISSTIADIEGSQIYIMGEKGEVLESLDFREDYNMTRIFSDPALGYVLTQKQFEEGDFKKDRRYFILLHNGIDPVTASNYILREGKSPFISGIILPVSDANYIENKQLLKLEDMKSYEKTRTLNGFQSFVIAVNKETGTLLRDYIGKRMIVQNQVKGIEDIKGRNIGGMIKGKSDNPDDTIVLATNYDYVGYEEGRAYKGIYYNGSSVGALLEIAKKINDMPERPEKNIVFLFHDASKYVNKGARLYAFESPTENDKGTFYLSLNNLGLNNNKDLYLDISQVNKSKDHFKYIKYLIKRGRELGIHVRHDAIMTGYEDAFFFKDYNRRSSVALLKGVNNKQNIEYFGKEQKDIHMIDPNVLRDHAQLLLDTLIYMAYDPN